MPNGGGYISIIGAGIGGLTAAIALFDAGFQVKVFEQSSTLTEVGAGIGVPPNACKVLRHLGLLEALEEVAVADTYGSYRDARTGEELRLTDHTKVHERFGAPLLRLHRWDLQQVLANGLERRAPGAIRLGRRLEHIEPGTDRVRLIFADGRHEAADVLIAADGIRSTVRTALFGADDPSFTGFVNWRGLVPVAAIDPQMRIDTTSFHAGTMVRNYFVRRGSLMNIVASVRGDGWVGEDWRIPGRKQDLLEAFANFYPEMRQLLAAIPDDWLFKWGLFLRPVLKKWVEGRVALLGDAAHPMLPYLGQGGAMAIEDAMLLARALAASATPQEGLLRYEAERIGRVNPVADASTAMGRLFHGDANDYSQARDMTAGQMPGLFTYDAVTAPMEAHVG